jgi:hypothetical protein
MTNKCIAEEENLFEMDMSLEDSDTEQELYPGTVLKGERSTLKDVEWIHETKINNHRMSSSKNVNVRIEKDMSISNKFSSSAMHCAPSGKTTLACIVVTSTLPYHGSNVTSSSKSNSC